MKHVNIYTILLAVGDYNESPSDLEQEYIYNNRGFFYTTPHFLDYLDETHKKIKLKKSSPRSYQINKTLKSYDQFLRIVMQDGQMQRYWLKLIKISLFHKKSFLWLSEELQLLYPNYASFYAYAQSNLTFLNMSYILDLLAFNINPLLQLKVVRLPKFLQKKYKKKYDFQIKHISKNSRDRYVFRKLAVYSSFVLKSNFEERVYNMILETLLNPLDNPLYKEKIKIYKNTLKTYKMGGINFKSL